MSLLREEISMGHFIFAELQHCLKKKKSYVREQLQRRQEECKKSDSIIGEEITILHEYHTFIIQ